MTPDPSNSIGVFDSGVGGLTVVEALGQSLPAESVLYFGDTARVPYGVKSPATIARYASQITGFLLRHPVKMLIVACNSMSAVAFEEISRLSPVPVIEVIGAGAAAAAAKTRNQCIGVIGTPATIRSNAYTAAVHRHLPQAHIVARPCPLLVPLVEEGWVSHPVTRQVIREYLRPVLEARVDTLILGCTHYPLLKPLLQEETGPGIELVDSAQAVARQAGEQLRARGLLAPGNGAAKPRNVFFVTDAPDHFRLLGGRFLRTPLEDVRLVQWQD